MESAVSKGAFPTPGPARRESQPVALLPGAALKGTPDLSIKLNLTWAPCSILKSPQFAAGAESGWLRSTPAGRTSKSLEIVQSPASIVRVRNLSKVYRQGESEITALSSVSLDIGAGEFLALMGPSGSGKSTLLHIIAGVDRPSSGTCRVQDVEVTQLNESALADWRNQHVGFVFQSFNLMPVLTAEENVELPLLLTRLSGPDRRRRVATALALVGLSDRARHLPRQMSQGQEQRVAIARALVTDPTLVVADEPTGNLDSQSARDVLALLQSLARDAGRTVIMVTHDPKAAAFGSRTLYLEKGELLDKTPD